MKAKHAEAMKLALEALEELDGIDTETECVTIDVGNVITALREALAEQPAQPAQQEPVQNNPLDCGVYLGSGKDHAIKHHVSYGPAQEKDQSVMYTYPSKPEPIPCGKPIGILMKLKGDEHMKLYPLAEQPAQRTWVGLTDAEWMNIVNKDHAWFGQRPEDVAHEVAKLVEAKLKEKNTP